MTYTAATVMGLVALTAIITWGTTNGEMLARWLWKSRKVGGAVQAAFDATILILVNMACWFLLIVNGVLWPSRPDPLTPPFVQAIDAGLLFVGTIAVSLALHVKRKLWMGGESLKVERVRE